MHEEEDDDIVFERDIYWNTSNIQDPIDNVDNETKALEIFSQRKDADLFYYRPTEKRLWLKRYDAFNLGLRKNFHPPGSVTGYRRNRGDSKFRAYVEALREPIVFERNVYWNSPNIKGHIDNVADENAALDIFHEHPEADMYYYRASEKRLWLKRYDSFNLDLRKNFQPLGSVTGYRANRGDSKWREYVNGFKPAVLVFERDVYWNSSNIQGHIDNVYNETKALEIFNNTPGADLFYYRPNEKRLWLKRYEAFNLQLRKTYHIPGSVMGYRTTRGNAKFREYVAALNQPIVFERNVFWNTTNLQGHIDNVADENAALNIFATRPDADLYYYRSNEKRLWLKRFDKFNLDIRVSYDILGSLTGYRTNRGDSRFKEYVNGFRPVDVVFERNVYWNSSNIQGHIDNVANEAEALSIFKQRPEVDLYYYRASEKRLWLKRYDAFNLELRATFPDSGGSLTGYRTNRGDAKSREYVAALNQRIVFEHHVFWNVRNLQGHIDNVANKDVALDMFKKRPDADLYYYRASEKRLWLKRFDAFNRDLRFSHPESGGSVTGYRANRGDTEFRNYILELEAAGNGKLNVEAKNRFHGQAGSHIFFEYPRSTHDYGPSGIGNNYWDTNDAAKYCTNKQLVKKDERWGKGGKQWRCLGHPDFGQGPRLASGYHGQPGSRFFFEYPRSTHDLGPSGIGGNNYWGNYWDCNDAAKYCTNKKFVKNEERWGKGGKQWVCLGHSASVPNYSISNLKFSNMSISPVE